MELEIKKFLFDIRESIDSIESYLGDKPALIGMYVAAGGDLQSPPFMFRICYPAWK
jgi:hypothetical protein